MTHTHSLKGIFKIALCLMTLSLLTSCSSTPSREVAGGEAGFENKETVAKPKFSQKRFIKNDTY